MNSNESTICYTVLNKRRIKTQQKRMTKNQQDLYKNDIWYSNVTEFWSSNATTQRNNEITCGSS